MISQKKLEAIRLLVSKYFKFKNSQPYHLTDGECEIFEAIVNPKYKWVWTSAPTRYGKTETIALALIYLAVFHNLKLPVVAGSEDKAKKIMEYVIMHLGDHPDLYEGLINVKDYANVERLQITVSKDALRWSGGGWIYITSVDSRSLIKEGEGVVGEGGDVVVLEEAGLIKNKEQFSKIVRMPEENQGWGKLVMSGNCIENSVFETAFNDPMYHKVRIDLEQAIKEGRYTQKSLDEKKTQTTTKDWKRYYLVQFPAHNEFTYFKPEKYLYLPRGLEYYGSLDPSLGQAKNACPIAIVVLGRDTSNGQIYEVESIVETILPDEAIRRIFNLPYKFQRFVIEKVQFQKYYLDEIKKKNMLEKREIPFDGINQSKNKIERIESLEPTINTKQILFKGGNVLWDEMQEYPTGKFVDGLDALEMAYRSLIGNDVAFGFI